MVKILITGFKHSGTTLLHQLVKEHPQVGWIENEEGFIEYDVSREWMMGRAAVKVENLKTHAWGEKLPWGTRKNDKNAERVIGFTKRWLKYFKGKARVLHIVRHPLDISLSRFPIPKVDSHKIDKKMYEYALNSVPIFINFLNSKKRCASVVYEDLLLKPEVHLHNIFSFLNLQDDLKTIKSIINSKNLLYGKIDKSRAYAFKNKKIESDFDYDKLKESIDFRL